MRTISTKGATYHLGWKRDRPDHRDHLFVPRGTVATLPARVDLRPQCSPVVDQGQLGSCTANSTTSMMESLYISVGRLPPVLSRLFVYYVSRVEQEGGDPREDSGCQIRDVMKAIATWGAALERTWPYDITKFADRPPASAFASGSDHKILRYQRCNGLHAILAALAGGHAIVGGFSVPENMESVACAETGVVNYPMPDEAIIGGHAVMFVGYDQPSEMLIFQNSWSDQWGNKGFGYLPFKFVTTQLADDFWVLLNEMMR